MLRCFLISSVPIGGFAVLGEIIEERNDRQNNCYEKNDDCAGIEVRKKEAENGEAAETDGKEGRAAGKDVGDGFDFASQPGTHGNAFFEHEVTNEQDTKLPVQDEEKKSRRKDAVNDETEETGYLHEGIGKGVEKFAKIADFVAFTGGHAVKHVGYFG